MKKELFKMYVQTADGDDLVEKGSDDTGERKGR